MSMDKKSQLIDLVRSLMYGTDDLLQETYALSEVLADIDGVPVSKDQNRLLLTISNLQIIRPASYSTINHTNE